MYKNKKSNRFITNLGVFNFTRISSLFILCFGSFVNLIDFLYYIILTLFSSVNETNFYKSKQSIKVNNL
jgi:hypothetical protein